METVTVRVDTLKRVIRDLEAAVQVCYNVESNAGDDCVKTYPYATGYSRSAMQGAIIDLNSTLQT